MYNIRGFSIVELVIVLLVISIIAVFVGNNWPGTVINVSADARQFANDVRYTQALSMAQSTRYRIVKNSSTSYQILNLAGSAIPFASGSTTQILNTGLTFGTWSNLTNNLIAFDGRGIPYLDTAIPGTPLTPGTTYSIPISGGGNIKVVTIIPLTGMVFTQ